MRKVSIALSAVGALLMLGATSAAQASTRVSPDATPACGNGCFNLYSLAFGRNQIQSVNIPAEFWFQVTPSFWPTAATFSRRVMSR